MILESDNMTGLPPHNGHNRQENGHSRKRTQVEMSDDDQDGLGSSHLGKPISMNGHRPNKKAKKTSMNGNNGTPHHNIELQKQRVQLPIHSGKEALVHEIREHDVTVLLGETGSGKTTQVPQYLLEAGLASHGMIACTQPRRVAAISLASRVATEQSRPLGSSVGYQVRFDEKTSEDTRIKYVTDGMLVRELLGDPLLSRYSIIIVDEAHERTLRTDILISNLKEIIKKRNAPSADNGKGKAKDTSNPLKVILMSATLDAEKFSKFFDDAKVLYIKGRQHPVKIYHTASEIPDYVDAACRTFFQIHIDQPPGDVLIFMPGQEDIESLENTIRIFAKQLPATSPLVHTCLLYAALSPAQQYKAFQPVPEGTRKCIIATNIAETSITVPGVKYVIDSGKFKEKNYIVAKNGHLGFDALMTRDVTKSSALQRAGRAGREGPGACFRLFTQQAFDSLPVSAEPEIRRCSLTSSMLEMKCLGMDMDQVEFMDPPDWMAITSAMKTLVFIGAFDLRNQLTPLGAQMAKFPLEPAHACAVLTARSYGPAVLSSVISIVSILSCTSKLFLDPSDPATREEASEARKKFRHPSGDHLTRLNALNAYIEAATAGSKNERKRWCKDNFVNERTCVEAINIREQVARVAGKLKIQQDLDVAENGGGQSHLEEGVLRSLTAGYATNTAFLQPDGTYKQLIGLSIIKIHPSSVLADKKVPAIIYDELTHTTQIYARGASSVMRRYIAELPGFRQKIS